VTEISQHSYAARVLNAGGDIALSLDEENPGSVTLDASSIPHVGAQITLAVEDAMLLAQLDPRASRRVVIDATRSDTQAKVYTPWVEERRNYADRPYPVAAGAGWVSNSNVSWIGSQDAAVMRRPGTASRKVVRQGAPSAASSVIASCYGAGIAVWNNAGRVQVVPGEVWTSSAWATADQSFTSRVIVGFYNSAGALVGSTVVGATTEVTPAGEWVRAEATATAPANAATVGIVQHNVMTGSGALTVGGEQAWLTDALYEKSAGPAGVYFDGNTLNDELTRTRWLGAANVSAAVVESRTVDHVEWVPALTRTFDLGIRETAPDRASGKVTLQLASDEAILDDFAQLTDDNGPRAVESSLRGVCNYVLGKIGAALAPGAADANVTAYWALTNLAINPAARVDATGWAAGSGATGVARFTTPTILGLPTIRFTASGTGQAFLNTPVQDVRVTPGQIITASIYMASATTARPARVMLRFKDQGGAIILDSFSDAVNTSTNAAAPTRLSRSRRVPPNATTVSVFINTTVNAATQNHYVSALMLHEGAELVPFFDGSTTNGGGYTYTYEDAPYTSTSTRAPDVERDPESLVWRAGISGMAFLHPLLLAAGLRLVCDEKRVWTLRNAGYRVDGDQAYRYGVNIETAEERLSREGDDWFDAAVYEYAWTGKDGIEQRRLDTFALSGTPTKVLRVEVPNTPYPGKGRAENIVRRAQGRGRTVTASAIPTWTEHTDQTVSVLLEGTAIQTGIAGSVEFNFENDTVTVSSRTVDTPPSAWVLIPIGQRWIDSPVGGSWIGEVI
jgi:hypothetical protein